MRGMSRARASGIGVFILFCALSRACCSTNSFQSTHFAKRPWWHSTGHISRYRTTTDLSEMFVPERSTRPHGGRSKGGGMDMEEALAIVCRELPEVASDFLSTQTTIHGPMALLAGASAPRKDVPSIPLGVNPDRDYDPDRRARRRKTNGVVSGSAYNPDKVTDRDRKVVRDAVRAWAKGGKGIESVRLAVGRVREHDFAEYHLPSSLANELGIPSSDTTFAGL